MCKRPINLLIASFSKSGLKLLLLETQHKLGEKWKYTLWQVASLPQTKHTHTILWDGDMWSDDSLDGRCCCDQSSGICHFMLLCSEEITVIHRCLFNTNTAPKSVYQHKIHTVQTSLWLCIQVWYIFQGAVYHLFWHCCQQHYHFPAHTETNVLKQCSHSTGWRFWNKSYNLIVS